MVAEPPGEAGVHLAGGGGAGVTTPARNPDTFLQPDGSYDWSKDPGGRYFLAAASRAGVKDLIGFVNSAPASMTTNGQSCSGNLAPGKEGEFGRYLAEVVDHFRKENVRIGYVSPMNEPDATTGCGQETKAGPLSLHFPGSPALTATGAVRTSATESLSPAKHASVHGSTATAQLPARSITTYRFQQRGGGR